MSRFVRFAARALATFSAAALVSCGGGGGGGSGGGGGGGLISGNYYPLDAGARWYYTFDGGEVLSVRVVGPGSSGAVSGTVVETDVPGLTEQTLYAVTADGIREYLQPPPADALGRALDGLQFFRFPLRAGDEFTQLDTTIDSGIDFDGDGRGDRIELRAVVRVIGLESVATAAGAFTDALRQRQTLTERLLPSGGGSAIDVTITVDTWYGNGIGPVQHVVRVVGPGIDESTTERLTAYGVGSRRSETVAPTVASVTPTQPVRAAVASVSAVLSEAIDPHSIGAATLTVRDAAGAVVPGTVALQSDNVTLRFTPTGAWGNGNHTATLDGVTDLVGNALPAPRVWSFAIDDAAPGVVASVPAMNAVDVPLTTASITVDFSEAIDPASVTALNNRLFDNGVEVPITVAASGNRVTLTPAQPLGARKTYSAQVTAFDLAGNPFVYNLSFKTLQGRFAYPSTLVESVVAPTAAIGDVNGDGMADVLLGTNANNMPPNVTGVFLLAGRADGTLAPPLRVDVGSQFTCAAGNIAIGDLDGDGRPDLALGGAGCGVQVLRQTASGALAVAEFLPHPTLWRLAIGDLEGDGRLDLVGIDADGTVSTWKRTGGAMALAATTLVGGSLGSKDLALGDIDGDGRLDIVLAVLGNTNQDVGVMLQQADGSFATASVYSADSFYGINRIAVGDLDGDGRVEVVASSSLGAVALFRPMPGGTLSAVTHLPAAQNGLSVAIADIDNDGRKDIVVGHFSEARLGILYQLAGGGFSAEDFYVANDSVYLGTQTLAAADVTGDGLRDVVLDGQLLRQLAGGGAGPMALARADRRTSISALRDALRK